MMHATSDSEVASNAPSSSSPAYYVQSPSRDSHDEADKCSSSNCRSPPESPSFPRHSMASSSSSAASRIYGNRRRLFNRRYCNVASEEDGRGYDTFNGDSEHACSGQQARFLVLVLALGIVFTAFCLVIWGASRPYKPQVHVKSLIVYSLYYGQGSDHTGVPTKVFTVNCSAIMVISNPATFFGIHVGAHPVNLLYSKLTLATGQLEEYYQPRKSTRIMSVNLLGREVPLYGTGMVLTASDQRGSIPLKLEFKIQSVAHLVGKLVKTKHTGDVSCSLNISSKHNEEITFKHDSCKYI